MVNIYSIGMTVSKLSFDDSHIVLIGVIFDCLGISIVNEELKIYFQFFLSLRFNI